MANRTYQIGFVIDGNAAGGVRALRQTENQFQSLNTTTNTTARRMESVRASGNQVTAMAVSMNRSIGASVSALAGYALGFVGVGAGIASFNEQLSVVDKIHKLNLRLGASTEALSEYSHVAALAGTDINKLSLSWQRQTRRVAEAAAGTGAARVALKELGLEAATLNELKPEEQFEEIAKALEKVTSKSDRLRLANKIFDSEGAAAALQIINQGTAAMEQQRIAARKLGLTISQEQATAVADLNDSVSNLGAAFTGLTREATGFVAGAITDDINKLSRVISGSESAFDAYGGVILTVSGLVASRFVPSMLAGVAAFVANTRASIAQAAADKNAAAAGVLRSNAAVRQAEQLRYGAQVQLAAARTIDQTTAANTKLARATQSVIGAQRAQTAAQQTLTIATQHYTGVASVAGTVTRGLKNAMGFLGGPVGVAILAATAIGVFATSTSEAEPGVDSLRRHIDSLGEAMDKLTKEQSAAKLLGLDKELEASERKLRAVSGRIETLKNNEAKGWLKEKEDKEELILKLAAEQTLQSDVADGLATKAKLQAIVAGEYKKSTVAAKNESDVLTGLTETNQKLIASYKGRVKALEKLKADKKALLAVEATTEKQQKDKAKALENINRLLSEQGKKVTKQSAQQKALLPQLERELELLKLTDRERFIESQLRKASVSEMAAQGVQLNALAGQLYDEKKAIDDIAAATKAAAKEVEPFTKAWEESSKRIDSTFADAWKGSFDSFSDFSDRLAEGFKQLLAELAHQAFTKDIVLNISSTIGGALGVKGLGGGSGGSTAGGPGVGDIFSLGKDLFSKANGVQSAFGGFAKSGIGQSLGLSSTSAAFTGSKVGIGATTSLSSAGEFISGGLSTASGLGGLTAGLLGLGSGNALVDTTTSVLGGAIGNMLLPGIGGAIGSFLGTAVGGLFGGKETPTSYSFTSQDDEERFEGRNALTLDNEFGETLFKVFAGRSKDTEIVEAMTPILSSISSLESVIASTFNEEQIQNVKAGVADADFRDENADTSLNGFVAARLSVILGELDETFGRLSDEAGLAGVASLSYVTSLVAINERLVDGGPLIDSFGGDLESMVAFLNQIKTEDQTLAQAFDGLVQVQSAYYQNFYTEQERSVKVLDAAKSKLADFNLSIGLTGAAALDTKPEFKAYIESLDRTTESGRQALQAALEFQGALLLVAGAAEAATAVTTAAAEAATATAKTQQSSLYNALFSEEEKKAHLLHSATEDVRLFNESLGLTGLAAIDTREELIDYVVGLDTATEAGKAAQTAAYLFQDSLIVVADAATAEAQRLASSVANGVLFSASTLGDTAYSDLTTRAQIIADNYQSELRAINNIHEARLGQLKEEEKLGKSLLKAVDSLSFSSLSTLTPNERFIQSQSQFAAIQVRAENGDLDALAQLQSSGQTYLKEAQSYYASGTGYQSAFDGVTSVFEDFGVSLSDADRLAEKEISISRQQLTAQEQLVNTADRELAHLANSLDVFEGIRTGNDALLEMLAALPSGLSAALQGILGVQIPPPVVVQAPTPTPDDSAQTVSAGFITGLYQAIVGYHADENGIAYWQQKVASGEVQKEGLADAMRAAAIAAGQIDGSHAKGLGFVPYDGYRAELHKGEMVLPAALANKVRSSNDSSSILSEISQGLKNVWNEISELRRERSQDAKTTNKYHEKQLSSNNIKTRLEALA